MKHKHHKIPRYRGGGDEPENLVEVTITQHIMWHFANYKLWGDVRDKRAYKMLSGHPGEEEWIQSISQARRAQAHITREQTRARHAAGDFYTKEGKQKVLAGCKRANDARCISVKQISTGVIYPGIKPAARATHTSANTIRRDIREGVGNWVKV